MPKYKTQEKGAQKRREANLRRNVLVIQDHIDDFGDDQTLDRRYVMIVKIRSERVTAEKLRSKSWE